MNDVSASEIRPATPDEAPLLHDLTQRSVLHWGYEPEFLEWEPQAIAVTPELIAAGHFYVLKEDGHVVGYYGLLGKPPEIVLDKLFVTPASIGTGRGKRLWQHAVATASDLGANVLTFAADPHAAPFYRAMGAQWTHEEPTSRPGWALQMFRYPLGAASADEAYATP